MKNKAGIQILDTITRTVSPPFTPGLAWPALNLTPLTLLWKGSANRWMKRRDDGSPQRNPRAWSQGVMGTRAWSQGVMGSPFPSSPIIQSMVRVYFYIPGSEHSCQSITQSINTSEHTRDWQKHSDQSCVSYCTQSTGKHMFYYGLIINLLSFVLDNHASFTHDWTTVYKKICIPLKILLQS